jgi:hypothetical protein
VIIMLQHRLYLLVLIFISVSLLLGGCSSTKLVNSWSDPNFAGQPIKKVLIVGVVKNEVNRRAYETHFAERLEKEGIAGVPAHQIISDSNKYTEEKIRSAVKEIGADAAIIAQLVSVEEQERYVPPTYEYEPVFGYGHGFYGYYGMSHRYVSTPGYVTTDTIVKLETIVFSTQSEAMIWAGATRSFNPSSATKIIKENTDIIINDMKQSGLL